VTLLGERAKELTGWENAYFSSHQIQGWLTKKLFDETEKEALLVEIAKADHVQNVTETARKLHENCASHHQLQGTY
jgi:hypothetical protein